MLSVRVENRTPPSADADPARTGRPAWLRRALVACHLLLEVDGGRFVSLLDPPRVGQGLRRQACTNDGRLPGAGGPGERRPVVLSLADHPLRPRASWRPQSETAFFDALEIDELLSLRTMTLSEEEKREVRGTDPRAAALLGEVDAMPAELWDRLHGTVRYLDSMTGGRRRRAAARSRGPAGRPLVGPGLGRLGRPGARRGRIGEVDVRRGTRVILRPGVRRADAYDLFLAGRTATVAAVLYDVDGKAAPRGDRRRGPRRGPQGRRTGATSTSRPTRSSRSRREMPS